MEPRVENLALLYQGALTATVRIQARRQQVGSVVALRQRMKDVLAEIGREAARRNYSSAQTSETDFAFVAFLDEVILSSDDPGRDDWAKKPLQEELFGVSTAGEQFFVRLEGLLARPDSAELVDALEVYYLCLLLGFRGRYITGNRAELQLYADRIRQRIERFRGTRAEFSPTGALPSESIAPNRQAPGLARLRLAALSSAGFALVCFGLFTAHLFLEGMHVNDLLLRSVVP